MTSRGVAGGSSLRLFPGGPVESPGLVTARKLQQLRRDRARDLGPDLFGDPAWEILLDLFVSHHDHRRLSVSAVCMGISGSAATAIRHISVLQAQGLVCRDPDPSDGRRCWVGLTRAGEAKLERLLARYAD